MKEELKKRTINRLMNNPKKLINGALTLGYDFTPDHCCLIVAQLRGKTEIAILNEFYDEEANEIFKKLLGKS